MELEPMQTESPKTEKWVPALSLFYPDNGLNYLETPGRYVNYEHKKQS
jgi:hypothetical protein